MDLAHENFVAAVHPVELDHRNDFTITFASIRHISTQTLGLDTDFFDTPVKTEPRGDIYAQYWPEPEPVVHHENRQTPPISPDSTTIGFPKCVINNGPRHHHQDYMHQSQVHHTHVHNAHVRRASSLSAQNIAHAIQRHCNGPLHTPLLPALQTHGMDLSCSRVSSTVQDPYPMDKLYPKPVYSYSCLIAMALKQSADNKLPVSEIYHYMQREFPYFRTAPEGWKNSVRHNLSLNKAFRKLDRDVKRDCSGSYVTVKKGCYWLLNTERIDAMDREIEVWKIKHPEAIRASMTNPDDFWNPPNSGISSPPPHISKSRRLLGGTSPHYQPYSKSRYSNSLTLDPKEEEKEEEPLERDAHIRMCNISDCYHGNPGHESSVAIATAEELVTTTLADIWEEIN